MNAQTFNMECSVVSESKKSDRLYFDMQVYEILEDEDLHTGEDADRTLIWRGIYVAMAQPGAGGTAQGAPGERTAN